MITEDLLPQARFLAALELVRHAGGHLAYSIQRVFSEPVDEAWVRALEQRPEVAERLEAFISRYARMQDEMSSA